MKITKNNRQSKQRFKPKDFSREPCTLILGSSLIAYPLYRIVSEESGYSQQGFIRFSQEHPIWRFAPKQNQLNCNFQEDCPIYSAAAPSQTLAGSTRLAEFYLAGTHQPHQILLFISPRDICDMWFEETSIAEQNIATQWHSFEQFKNFAFALPLYAHRTAFQLKVMAILQQVYSKVGLDKERESQPYELWQKSLIEYAKHYKNMGATDARFGYLQKLGQFCQRENIKLTLINLPLSTDNLALMPNGFYAQYRQKLEQCQKEFGLNFVDLSQSSQFSKNDFHDSAHLSASGGRKLLERILPEFCQVQHN